MLSHLSAKLKFKSKKRASGILLHVTSLPSDYGIGDFGPRAYEFIDSLSKMRQKFWQILPLNPTDEINFHSPYSCFSAFAGNTLLISPQLLIKDGWIKETDIHLPEGLSSERVNYQAVSLLKKDLIAKAFENFLKVKKPPADYGKFCSENKYWLEDFALFVVLKEHFDLKSWIQWPVDLKTCQASSLKVMKDQFTENIKKIYFEQYLFGKQWNALRAYCRKKDVQIIGDIPIYVTHDSPDVWTHQDLFELDENGEPTFVGGVPPDYFSATGQRWGNPVYRWAKIKKTGYAWWVQRIKRNLALFDHIRIDHFRGFAGYWQIPVAEATAVNGQWVKGPSNDFFNNLKKHFSKLPIIAEDLGIITPDVTALMKKFGFPGMKVLLFAFGGDSKNPYLPENHVENCILYTGTHDNNTALGWFQNEASQQEKENLLRYLGKKISERTFSWKLVELAFGSIANTVITPVQDILGLDAGSRMNIPGTTEGNWQWRLDPRLLTTSLLGKFKRLTEVAKRA